MRTGVPSKHPGATSPHPDHGRWTGVIGLSSVAVIMLLMGTNDRLLHVLFGGFVGPGVAREVAPNRTASLEDTAIHTRNYALPVRASTYFGDAPAVAATAAAASVAASGEVAGVKRDASAMSQRWRAVADSLGPDVAPAPPTCLQRCCWSLVPATFSHPGVAPGAPVRQELTPEDFLSPVNNKRIADVALGGLPKPEGYTYAPELSDALLPCLRNGTVIWVDTPSLNEFVEKWLPRIRFRFVLMSGDSDEQAPGNHLQLLQDPRVVHWLAMNCNRHATADGKLTCLPLGVSQWTSFDDRKDNFLRTIARAVSPRHLASLPPERQAWRRHPKPPSPQRNLLVGFYIPNNAGERAPAMQLFCGHEGQGPRPDLGPVVTCLKSHDGGLSLLERYDVIAEHRFVLSPAGMGPDCYRTWEALLLGSYPIVKSGPLNSEYEHLPVLVVDQWDQVTPELLDKTYDAFRQRTDYMWGKMYLRHYQRLVSRQRLAAGLAGDQRQRLKYWTV